MSDRIIKFEYLTTGECISQSFHNNVDVVIWSVKVKQTVHQAFWIKRKDGRRQNQVNR